MALDPSIALGVKPLEVANPLAQYGQIAQLQAAQNQNALAQYQLSAAQRQDQEANALRQALPENFDISNPTHVNALLRASPTSGAALLEKLGKVKNEALTGQKLQGEINAQPFALEETKNRTSKLAAETLDKNLANFNKTYSPLSAAAAGVNGVQDYVNAMYDDPILGAVAGRMKPRDAAIQENVAAFQADPNKWVAAHSQLDGKSIIETLKGTRQNVNMGGTNQGQTVDAFGRVVPGSVVNTKITNTPFQEGELANMAAGRALQAVRDDPYNINGVQAAFPIQGARVGGVPSSDQKQPSGAPVIQNVQAAMKAGLTGEDLLTHLPTGLANQVRAIGEGREPSPSSRSLTTPGGRQLMDLVMTAYPTYDAKQYATMGTAEKAFTSGKKGDTARSLNVAVDHLGTLEQAANALQNGDTRLLNQVGNYVALQTGQTAPTDFNAVKRIVADEITKAVLGGGGALGDRKAVDEAINGANGPKQLKEVIARYKNLMGGQLTGLEQQYKASTNKTDFKDRFLTPTTKAALTTAAPATVAPNIDALLDKYK